MKRVLLCLLLLLFACGNDSPVVPNFDSYLTSLGMVSNDKHVSGGFSAWIFRDDGLVGFFRVDSLSENDFLYTTFAGKYALSRVGNDEYIATCHFLYKQTGVAGSGILSLIVNIFGDSNILTEGSYDATA